MPIRVTCPGCHTRFNVSEKHAGKEGPCPKCKKIIRIPDKAEEVVIHAPDNEGPVDSTGRPTLRPIKRKETKLSGANIAMIVCSIIGFLICALMMRFLVEDKSQFGWVLLGISALLIGPPVVYGAYTFLRDQELGSFGGQELIVRVLVCSLIYALLWFAMSASYVAFGDKYEMGSWGVALGAMLAAGGAVGMLALDFDYLMGLVHYGMYLGVCLIARQLAGIGLLPGMLEKVNPNESQGEPVAWLEALSTVAESAHGFLLLFF